MDEKSLARTGVPDRNSQLRTFLDQRLEMGLLEGIKPSLEHCPFPVHMESEGVRVRPFSCTRDLLDHRAQLLLDSLYIDYVGVVESTQSVS